MQNYLAFPICTRDRIYSTLLLNRVMKHSTRNTCLLYELTFQSTQDCDALTLPSLLSGDFTGVDILSMLNTANQQSHVGRLMKLDKLCISYPKPTLPKMHMTTCQKCPRGRMARILVPRNLQILCNKLTLVTNFKTNAQA